jgi:type I restriction enzyme M protein
VFKDIRNHLAGMTTGITRDEALAQEIINLLFCKIFDEINTAPADVVTFRSGIEESPNDVKSRIVKLFKDNVKGEYSDVFDEKDSISLDPESVVYVVGELQNYCVTMAERDAVADAFEIFIGPALRGSEGQFFTPRNVIKMMVQILDPKNGEKIIDPACGSGGFLINSLEHVWRQIEKEGKTKEWDKALIERKKRDVATKCFRGIDKDSFLAKVTKAYMAIVGDGRGGIFCENSLVPPGDWNPMTQAAVQLGGFDVVLTNPPFGKKIVVKGERLLSQYNLGFKYSKDKKTGTIAKTTKIHEDQPPQIIFLERCLQLLRAGGRMAIVLPEAAFGMPTYEYVVSFLRERAKIFGIVSMPEALFKTSGKGGTHAKVCIVFIENSVPKKDEEYKIFMADAKWCGHDSRGNPTIRKDENGKFVLLDDIPKITLQYKALMAKQ